MASRIATRLVTSTPTQMLCPDGQVRRSRVHPQQLQQDQSQDPIRLLGPGLGGVGPTITQDPIVYRVQAWVGVGQRSPWATISALDPEIKALSSQ